MKVERLAFATGKEQEAATPAVIRHLEDGGLIATPTETVYGLGCAPEARPLERLARLKGRGANSPFLVLVAEAGDAPVRWTPSAEKLAAAFWPGPLTLVLQADRSLPQALTGASGTVAVRATPHAGMRRLLAAWRRPLPSTSANPRGEEPAQSATAVYEWIRTVADDDTMLILDGGTLPASPPSTLVDCTGPRPRLLREGALERAELERIVHDIEPRQTAG